MLERPRDRRAKADMLRNPRLGTYGQFLHDAFSILEDDRLVAYATMSDALKGLVINAEIESEGFHICGEQDPRVVPDVNHKAAVSISMNRAALIDLVDGQTSLMNELRRRRISIRGTSPALLKLARAQHAFTEGAVRTRRMEALFVRFRNHG